MYYLRVLLLTLFLVNSLCGTLWSQDEGTENIEEEVYLSLRYQGVIDEIVVAYYSAGKFYLPLTALLDLFAINYELSASSLSVSGYFLKEDQRYFLDFSRQIASFKTEEFKIDVNDYLVKEVDFFITPKIFDEVFGLTFTTDLSRLTLKLTTSAELPIITRHNRRAKKNLKDAHTQNLSNQNYELHADRDPQILNGAFGDYSFSSTTSRSTFDNNLNLRLGGELLFGDVQGNLNSIFSKDTIVFNGSALRWHYANMSEKWFTNASLGQFGSSGPTNSTFKGFLVNNEPLTPQVSYDTYVIDEVTEPDAEVELYQDNRLVDVTRANESGYYRFLVPLNYGTSDFKVRIYAKQGRIIELDRRIQIPFNFLRAKEYRYEISGGQVSTETLYQVNYSNTLHSKISLGVNDWMTGELGVEYVEDKYEDKPIAYSKVSTRVTGDILVGLDVALQNYYRLSMRGVGPNMSSFSMEYSLFDPQAVLNPAGYIQQFSGNIFYPFQIAKIRFTSRASSSWIETENENRLSVTMDVNQNINGYRIQYGIKEQHTFYESSHGRASEVRLGVAHSIPRIPSVHKLLRGSYLNTDLTYNTVLGKAEELRFQYFKKIGPRLKLRYMSTHSLQQDNSLYELGFTWDLDVFQSTSTLRTDGVASHSYSQTLRGSLALDRQNGEVLWDSRQQVGRAGVSIRMFEDANNSGTYDMDEKIIPGNAVTIERASSRLVTKSGITRLTQLQPYRHYNFKVNEARIKNPMLVSSKPQFSVITDPNSIKRIDVPFYTTGIIEGRIDRIQGDKLDPISGLRIHIRKTDGSMETTLRTFADGSYYSMEIPPGDYEVWVDDNQLEFLGMLSSPEKRTFTVISSPDGDYIEGLNFILE